MLILNKLLKIQDAQNYQNAGNAVLEYATSTRDFGMVELHTVALHESSERSGLSTSR